MKIIKMFVVSIGLLYLYGCASGAKMENMAHTDVVVTPRAYDAALKNGVEVASVTGGEETNPAWTSEIGNEEFSGAVKQSLASQGLLAETGRYQLQIELKEVDQPMFGFDMTVTTHVRYVLTDSQNSTVIFDDTLAAAHTATVSDAFVAIKRLQMANEGAGKKNIEALLKKLSELKISTNQVSVVD
ncbi:hypothetical protein BOW53_10970 [Solemya pervernicosa gill symbiont]|uniref:Lipoprotein n=1 Tax=Solemya pervernicosa gill symbiont TaxID=642797 RepID=A0A1T2L3F4_9GAMM|nr:hypothetical protein [Solemya pervernicosa gill symbiont]OOZ39599.1 hypothetical protein BOW53_10970 [Solemya pervernicosa gill symbiont]